MKLGELPSHPDFNRLVSHAEKELDKATDAVVGAGRNGQITEVRYAAGRQLVWDELLAGLREAKKKAG